MESKIAYTPDKLCEGISYEFVNLLKYARELNFEDKPDYKRIKLMFKNSVVKNGGSLDWEYDWDKKKVEDRKEGDEKSEKSEKTPKDE
jgi:hypothetical protein